MKPAFSSIFPMILLMTIATSSCNQTGKKSDKTKSPTETENDSLKKGPVLQQDSANPAAENKELSKANETGDLAFLKKSEGRYPNEIKFLENPAIQQRLRTILGDRFSFLKEKWAVETPIEIKNDIFIASACEAHNCSDTNFMIAIDMVNDLMFVGIREGKNAKLYYEIENEPPQALLDWVNKRSQ